MGPWGTGTGTVRLGEGVVVPLVVSGIGSRGSRRSWTPCEPETQPFKLSEKGFGEVPWPDQGGLVGGEQAVALPTEPVEATVTTAVGAALLLVEPRSGAVSSEPGWGQVVASCRRLARRGQWRPGGVARGQAGGGWAIPMAGS